MSSDNIESEDLANVPLVRMEDVQPSRERLVPDRTESSLSIKDEEVFETYVLIDDIEYENECIVHDDEDSNIGSMVSLHSEDYHGDSSNEELIIPEVLEEVETRDDLEVFAESEVVKVEEYLDADLDKKVDLHLRGTELVADNYIVSDCDIKHEVHVDALRDHIINTKYVSPININPRSLIEIEVPPKTNVKVEQSVKTSSSESWPTLEILPGGVIKNSDKYENESSLCPEKIKESVMNTGEMMYACAKCSQTFKYLFCLVKHVKWHEDQSKYVKLTPIGQPDTACSEYICLHSDKKKIVESDRIKRKAPKRLKS